MMVLEMLGLFVVIALGFGAVWYLAILIVRIWDVVREIKQQVARIETKLGRVLK